MSWHKVKLKTLLSQPVQNGYSPVCPEEPNGKWVLGLGALSDFGLDTTQIKPAPVDDSKVDNFLLRPGDFLVSRSNTRDKVGRSALFKGEIKNCSYPDLMMRFRVNEIEIYPEFLEVYLRSHAAVKYFQRSASGTSGTMVKINKRVVENLQIPLPPILEQTAIADLLSTWDAAIEKTEKLIAAKEKRFLWLLNMLLGGELRLCSYKQKWRKVKFREVFESFKKVNRNNDNHEVLSVTKNGIVNQAEYFNKDVASKDKSKYLIVERGTLVMSGLNFWMGSIDFQNIRDIGIVSPAYKTFRVKSNEHNKNYLRFLVRSKFMTRILIGASVQGASIVRRNLDSDMLNNSTLTLPSLEEQEAIANTLVTAESEISLLKQLSEGYLKQKRGLMQKLLTGQWRVRTEEAA